MLKQFEIRTFSKDEALVERRREHIVQCSIKVLTKKGYNATNMRELAEAYISVQRRKFSIWIIHSATSLQAESIESFADGLDNANPTDALIQLIKMFYQWHHDNQDTTLFAYQETKNLSQNARQQIFKSERRILAVFERLLMRGIESGEFNVSDPKLIAHNMMVVGHSWALRRWFLRKYWTFEKYVKEQTDIIMKEVGIDPNRVNVI